MPGVAALNLFWGYFFICLEIFSIWKYLVCLFWYKNNTITENTMYMIKNFIRLVIMLITDPFKKGSSMTGYQDDEER